LTSPQATYTGVILEPSGVICQACDNEIQRNFAAEHVRKGFWDPGDLELLGITEDQANAYRRERRVRILSEHSVEDLRDALKLAESKP